MTHTSPIDVINENGGRAILPHPGMTCADAYVWAKFRGDGELMARFAEFSSKNTYQPNDPQNNNFIDESAVIHKTAVITNSIILSTADEPTRIGSNVDIRNSVVGRGNRVDSAAQLDTVMTGTRADISKAARITHSVIGDCAHIACCEIAHALIAPFHAQHHNNSFLIAAHVGGQSNAAAGATIGSNHNSRAPDGEIWAKRGFWPGLCVSLKHNSKFASFTMIAKGSYTSELDVKLPFSLVAIDSKSGETVIFPAYWFTHNMYAAMRSAQKFVKRDNRIHRSLHIEHDILAPDTVEEMFEALHLLKSGEPLNMERGHPETTIKNLDKAREAYMMMIRHYCAKNILPYIRKHGDGAASINALLKEAGAISDGFEKWLNCGGTVISVGALAEIIAAIKTGKSPIDGRDVNSWNDVHRLFDSYAALYPAAKLRHALKSLAKLEGISVNDISDGVLARFIKSVPDDCKKIADLTRASRAKDFTDPFRMMAYDSEEEANAVLGSAEDAVVRQTVKEMEELAALAVS